MKIMVIGSGCPVCLTLHKMVLKLRDEGKLDKNTEIEYSKDINELIELGVMGSPALVVDGRVVSVGMPNSQEQLLNIIKGRFK